MLKKLNSEDFIKTGLDISQSLPDQSWGYFNEDDELTVCASIWYSHTPEDKQGRLGLIGAFWCNEKIPLTHSQALFYHLTHLLKHKGCTKIIGPMNGNTWQDYRLVIAGNDRSAFLLEPFTPDYYVTHWQHAGFEYDEIYSSYWLNIEEWFDSRIDRIENRLAQNNIVLRSLEKQDLEKIYNLSIQSFTHNPYYMNLDKDTYMNKYGAALALISPNLSLVAIEEGTDELVGYLFAVPDFNQKSYQDCIDTVILKTVAVKSGKNYAGLGILMMAKCFDKSRKLGMNTAIHALMHDGNPVQNIAREGASLLRKYALFSYPFSHFSG
jgi:predicted N-acetyltransferase YhbS